VAAYQLERVRKRHAHSGRPVPMMHVNDVGMAMVLGTMPVRLWTLSNMSSRERSHSCWGPRAGTSPPIETLGCLGVGDQGLEHRRLRGSRRFR
jgi:hypothetical protein